MKSRHTDAKSSGAGKGEAENAVALGTGPLKGQHAEPEPRCLRVLPPDDCERSPPPRCFTCPLVEEGVGLGV